ncbi:MAG: hypothetical protein IID08_08230 [Candidatus Hydrogenedentes bacterium]|nr:hypothetical protein [Candidatus Hydrogenedentota bacterium]
MPSNTDPKSLRSRFLTGISDNLESEGTKKLKRHMRDLLTGLDDPTRDKCLAILGEMREMRTERQKDVLIDSIVSEDAAQRARVENSLSVLRFFMRALLHEDTPAGDDQLWADDLETLGWLDQKSRPVFETLLKKLTGEYLPALRVQDRRRKTEAGVLPNFKSLGITVEARAVRMDRFRWGMPLEGDGEYHPEIIGTAMIASVHVGVDEGFPEDFYFQMDETNIDNFVGSLLAAKKEMLALRSYLNLDNEGMIKRNV